MHLCIPVLHTVLLQRSELEWVNFCGGKIDSCVSAGFSSHRGCFYIGLSAITSIHTSYWHVFVLLQEAVAIQCVQNICKQGIEDVKICPCAAPW